MQQGHRILPVHFDFSAPKKRSVSVLGHKTSFTLEDNFWFLLKHYATNHNMSVASVVVALDKQREAYNHIGLSCIIRQFIMNNVLENHMIYKEL
jgi:predicted DNA-binding ribbon-helix-helix protein